MFEGREWHGTTGASREALEELCSVAPSGLPEAYLKLLSFTDGGEGPLPVEPFNLCMDPVSSVVELIRTGNDGQSDFEGFLIFGGNGGGEYLAFDMRNGPRWPVVTIDMVAGGRSAGIVASDFDTFLDLIGIAEA